MTESILWFDRLDLSHLPAVGGKNASLGEMTRNLTAAGVAVPGGFATTADAFRATLSVGGLADRINARLRDLDVDDVLALQRAGAEIRAWVADATLPADFEAALRAAYRTLCDREGGGSALDVAVRSSATAEDLPDASFAGQQETFLNVRGEDDVVRCVRLVFASLYNDRAIAYRVHQGFDQGDVALSAGIQRMVRSDLGASGVAFTLDTESGFRDVVFITSSWGLGELVVQGAVNPDEFYVHKQTLRAGKRAIVRRTIGSKQSRMIYSSAAGERLRTESVSEGDRRRFSLSDHDVHALAKMALTIEDHYGRPMDIEWGKDGRDGSLWILQARPETVRARAQGTVLERWNLGARGVVLSEGRAIGARIGSGVARVIKSAAEMHKVEAGDVLVTDMTDPDWEPVMKKASAIVTNRGGRTCHAAIIARELGVPAVVGCRDATERVPDRRAVTVSCSEGETGFVYDGQLPFEHTTADLAAMPPPPLKIMMNVGNPERAFDFAQIPNAGIGLARLEFVIARQIGIHPRALLEFDQQSAELRARMTEMMAGWDDPVAYFVDRLAEGIATLAAAFSPHPVIVRTSDFKSNEYANLLGGAAYEPHEENPMIGFRGASRYLAASFRECFALECRALRRVREEMGLENVWVMIPFVRTVAEGKAVIDLLAEHGLRRGERGLNIIMMCEVPSNALLADQFLDHFDGFSIGSNDLTQLTLGLDRDSALVAHLFDERDDAVKVLLEMAISACNRRGKYIGICGQGPSDHPDLAQWLVDRKIGSVSLNPDTVVETWLRLAERAAS